MPVERDDVGERAAMAINRANWDSRVPVHTGPGGYSIEQLVDDGTALTDVVEFDRPYLGDLAGVAAVHLQCHIGTDTVSLARLGADITGIDFSEPAIEVARDLARRCGIDARFVVGDVHDAPSLLGRTYDLVYTGVGALNWLPDIGAWAAVVADVLRPGGRLHLTEGHPMAMTLSDDATPDNLLLDFPYFEGQPPSHFVSDTSYLGTGTVTSPETVEWSHHLGAVVTALIQAGIIIDRLDEHRELAWPLLPWMEPAPDRQGWYRFPEPLRQRMPLSYTIQAHKRH